MPTPPVNDVPISCPGCKGYAHLQKYCAHCSGQGHVIVKEVPPEKKCTFEECPNRAVAHRLCSKHYAQNKRKRLGTTKEVSSPGNSRRVTISMSKASADAAFYVAKREGKTRSEWINALILKALEIAAAPK